MKRGKSHGKRNPQQPPPTAPPAPVPFKPQRKLLIVLSIVFAGWITTLIVLYIVTPADKRKFTSPSSSQVLDQR